MQKSLTDRENPFGYEGEKGQFSSPNTPEILEVTNLETYTRVIN